MIHIAKLTEEDLRNDLELVLDSDEITLDAEGLLSYKDYVTIFKLIKKYLEPRVLEATLPIIHKRRQALSEKRMDDYRSFVQEAQEKEEQVTDEVFTSVLEPLNLSPKIFQDSHVVTQLPENQKKFSKVQQTIASQAAKQQMGGRASSATMSKAKAIEIVKYEH